MDDPSSSDGSRLRRFYGSWVAELCDLPGAEVADVGVRAVRLSLRGLPLGVDSADRRRSLFGRPRVVVKHISGWSFDLGECVSVLDSCDAKEISGRGNLELLRERFGELERLSQDPEGLDALIAARESWTTAGLGPLAHGSPAVLSPELQELDGLLAARGFALTDEGLVEDGVVSQVRRRGPVRILLAVQDGRASVGVSLWPVFGWYDIDAIRHLLVPHTLGRPDYDYEAFERSAAAAMTLDLPSGIEALVAGLDHLLLSAFEPQSMTAERGSVLLQRELMGSAGGSGLAAPSRTEWTAQIPLPLGAFVQSDQYGSFSDWLVYDPPALSGASEWNLRCTRGAAMPDVIAGGWSVGVNDPIMSGEARAVLEPHLPDRTWFTFYIDGSPRHAAIAGSMAQGSYLDLSALPEGPLPHRRRDRRVHSARIAATRDGLMNDQTSLSLCRQDFREAVLSNGITGVDFEPVWRPPS